MSSPEWRDATLGDRGELKNWICADPANRVFESATARYSHPEQWVLDVQSGFRDLNPPISGDDRLILCRDDVGIAGAAYFGLDRNEGEFWIYGIASAVRSRRTGLCRTGLNYALGEILSWRAGLGITGGVVARIHEKNIPSKAFFTSAGWECTGIKSGAFEIWDLDLPIESGKLDA